MIYLFISMHSFVSYITIVNYNTERIQSERKIMMIYRYIKWGIDIILMAITKSIDKFYYI